MTPPNRMKMAAFAREAGVAAPTIRHYVREGLLAEPVRTSRTMAYYDRTQIPRVRAIKQIQEALHMPLPLIREVLEEVEEAEDGSEDLEAAAMTVAIRRVLERDRSQETRTRAQLLASGMPENVLDSFLELGIVSPTRVGKQEVYAGDDVALLRTLKQARRAGLSPDMLPPSILVDYMKALGDLVRVELRLFREGVLPLATDGQDVGRLSETAARLSERLVVQLRRKLLLPMVDEMFETADRDED